MEVLVVLSSAAFVGFNAREMYEMHKYNDSVYCKLYEGCKRFVKG